MISAIKGVVQMGLVAGRPKLTVVPVSEAKAGMTKTAVQEAAQINVVLNWFEELKERVPVP